MPSARQPEVRLTAISDLKQSLRNTHTHSQKQIQQIAESIQQFGWTSPIVVDEAGKIIAGHGRFAASLDLRLRRVPTIVVSGLSEAEKRALALADNKIAANAGWDRSTLAAELGELATLLPEISLDISITGFDAAEIDALATDFVDPEREPAEEIPAAADAKPVTQAGDLWKLGEHRLLCGDACDESALQTLMGADRASMLFADPPYNVRIAATVGRGRTKHREFASASGEMSRAQFTAFLNKWMKLATAHSANGSIHYVCIDWRHLAEMLAAGSEVYSELKNIVVWVKTNAGQGSFYRSQHEFILVFKSGDAPHLNNVELGKHGRNRSNVWTYAGVNSFRAGRMDELSIHPTVKPIPLVSDAIRDCSRRGEIVLDPFMGSGTTILAAERVGRRGYGLEIDPLYVDVAIRRWQSFTGRDAILSVTGQTFDEVTDHGRNRNRKSRRSL
ncbi:ParB N-terminal domain-containing protein [Bradyrhizobium sp. AUGA SZCCT0283]|nr:ParB N-terminal domain-containing protein [Bradyrhizobium sp. AUGA SZCCT0283]